MIIDFVPNRELLKSTDSSSRFYKQLVNNSETIKNGDLLFTVIGYGLGDDFSFSGEPEEIGYIF